MQRVALVLGQAVDPVEERQEKPVERGETETGLGLHPGAAADPGSGVDVLRFPDRGLVDRGWAAVAGAVASWVAQLPGTG